MMRLLFYALGTTQANNSYRIWGECRTLLPNALVEKPINKFKSQQLFETLLANKHNESWFSLHHDQYMERFVPYDLITFDYDLDHND